MNDELKYIPSDPDTRDNLKKAIIDISNQTLILDGHKSAIKEAIKAVSEEYEMPSKFVNKLVRSYYRDNFESQNEEFEDFVDLYNAIFGPEELNE